MKTLLRALSWSAALGAVPLSVIPLASVTPAAQAASVADRTSTMFVVRDPAIDEDSALVKAGRFFVTTNDNGNSASVYTLNQDGRTVGVTQWAKSQVDSEAIAPIDAGHVWLGDIGDNYLRRTSIVIAKVPVGRGDRDVRPRKFHLVYPDGPHNAETLVRNPVTGRLYIATKDVAGGALYAVPKTLVPHATNTLRRVAQLPEGILHTATDGAFFSGGNYLVIRNYTEAALYAWPSMAPVGTFRLPRQLQGEGLATDTGGSVNLSSEGLRQPVLHYRMPAKFRRALKTPPAS